MPTQPSIDSEEDAYLEDQQLQPPKSALQKGIEEAKRKAKEKAIGTAADHMVDQSASLLGQGASAAASVVSDVASDYADKALSVAKWGVYAAVTAACPPLGAALAVADLVIPQKYKDKAKKFVKEKAKKAASWLVDKVKEKAGDWLKGKLNKLFGKKDEPVPEKDEAQKAQIKKDMSKHIQDGDITKREERVQSLKKHYHDAGSYKKFVEGAVWRPESSQVRADAPETLQVRADAPEPPRPITVNFTAGSKNVIPFMLALMQAGANINQLTKQGRGPGLSVTFSSEQSARDMMQLLSEQGARFRADFAEDINPLSGHFYSPGRLHGHDACEGILLERDNPQEIADIVSIYQPDQEQLQFEESEYMSFLKSVQQDLIATDKFEQEYTAHYQAQPTPRPTFSQVIELEQLLKYGTRNPTAEDMQQSSEFSQDYRGRSHSV